MKKKLLFMALGVSVIFVVNAAQEIDSICPGSGIICEVTLNNADGSSISVKSQKDKDKKAVIYK
jgi:hypothetical protein